MFTEQNLRGDIASVWGEHGAHIDVFDAMLAMIAKSSAEREIGEGWEPADGVVIRHDDDLWVFVDGKWVSTVADVALTAEAKWWRHATLVADPRWR